MIKIKAIILLCILFSSVYLYADDAAILLKKMGVRPGITQTQLEKKFPRATARTYRQENNQEWITFDLPPKVFPPIKLVTFHLMDNRVADWSLDDRQEVVREYLQEFCSQTIITGHPKIFTAIKNVFEKIPTDVLLAVTKRSRPVFITEYHTRGIGRYASSSEIIATPDDIDSMQDGFTLLKLTTELEDAQEPRAIEGIVAHELAHRYLEHFKRKPYSCKFEKEANHLIQDWGFKEEFKLASQYFGAHTEGQASECNE